MLNDSDKKWLQSGTEKKWEYVSGYIQKHWPKYIQGYTAPVMVSDNKKLVTQEIEKLANSQQNNNREILRKTKEAWRTYESRKSKKDSGNWINVKILKHDRKHLERLAKEADLTSLSETISYLISSEYNKIIESKRKERERNELRKAFDRHTKRANLPQKRESSLTQGEELKVQKLVNSELISKIELLEKNIASLCSYCAIQTVALAHDKSSVEFAKSEGTEADSLAEAIFLNATTQTLNLNKPSALSAFQCNKKSNN